MCLHNYAYLCDMSGLFMNKNFFLLLLVRILVLALLVGQCHCSPFEKQIPEADDKGLLQTYSDTVQPNNGHSNGLIQMLKELFAPPQTFRWQFDKLMMALQADDWQTVRQYAAPKGLGAFLYINIAEIECYELLETDTEKGNIIKARVILNNIPQPFVFSFLYQKEHWVLQDIENSRHNVPFEIY